jgi:hypothetical protein
MIETKSKEHIYKKKLSNQLTMIFQKQNLEKHGVILIQHGSKNMIDWNTAFQKMLRIAYIVISSNKTLEIKQEETCLLLKGLEIGRRKRNYRVMWGLIIVHIIKLDKDVKVC